MGARARHVCPICAREVPARDGQPPNPSFPFCAPACKLVDLGKWLDGTYRVPGPPLESTGELDELGRNGSSPREDDE